MMRLLFLAGVGLACGLYGAILALLEGRSVPVPYGVLMALGAWVGVEALVARATTGRRHLAASSLRQPKAWYRRGLWAVALVFAGCLIGLGSAIVRDLPKVEPRSSLSHYLEESQISAARSTLSEAEKRATAAQSALDQARLAWRSAHADTEAAGDSLQHWLATRTATQSRASDPEVINRTHALDGLRQAERDAQARVQTQEKALLNVHQEGDAAQRLLSKLERDAHDAQERDYRKIELTVFAWRLAFALPLLLLAVWVFRRFRASRGWPFAWGYIGFAVYTFFVELVPYLPSYGGYVRYTVGVIGTVVVGRWVIQALQALNERQRALEAQPEAKRREGLSYDRALGRLATSLCPGCERGVDLNDDHLDFCPHCGIGLHDHCGHCAVRKNAFARFCIACGAPAHEPPPEPDPNAPDSTADGPPGDPLPA